MKRPILKDSDYYWAGGLEECDCCHDAEVPICWIVYTGRQFLCYDCMYGKDYLRNIYENKIIT